LKNANRILRNLDGIRKEDNSLSFLGEGLGEGQMKPKPHRFPSTPRIKQQAKNLRKEMTPAEQKLWQHLRNRRLFELKFRRQHPVGRFILDFYCYEHPLIVEVDGGIHELQTERDQMPTEWLQQQGYRVIRFKNEEVISNIEGVLTGIARVCGRIK